MRSKRPLNADHLLKLARDKSTESRRTLAAIISDLFVGNAKALTERERTLMFDILRHIVGEVETQVRRLIAENLADVPRAPRDLALRLANDRIEVAYPILARSRALHDEDLIEVIRNRTLEHQMAIAIRRGVSEPVSDALVRQGAESVIRALLENANAKISDATLEYLVEQSRRVDTFQEPILRRADLPPDLAKRMFVWVSAALRQYILDHYKLKPSLVDDLLEKTACDAVASLSREGRRPGKSEALVGELMSARKLTPDLLVAVLEEGEVNLFTTMLRKMTGLRDKLAMRILLEPSGEGLAIACKSIGMGKALFASVFALTRRARPSDRRHLRRRLRKVMTLYDRMTKTAACEVVNRWRRDIDYLSAVRELELTATRHG